MVYAFARCTRSGSELLDPSNVTQCEVQVGHRYKVLLLLLRMPVDVHARAKTGGAGGTQRCYKGSQATSGGGEGELSGRRLWRGRGKGRKVSERRERKFAVRVNLPNAVKLMNEDKPPPLRGRRSRPLI